MMSKSTMAKLSWRAISGSKIVLGGKVRLVLGHIVVLTVIQLAVPVDGTTLSSEEFYPFATIFGSESKP